MAQPFSPLLTGASEMVLTFKQALVQILLKKPNLDTSICNNFRPISKLSFISKILEKVVLESFLNGDTVLKILQSGFELLHSTESALSEPLNDFNDVFNHHRRWNHSWSYSFRSVSCL